jgi:hypothetical protein
MKRRRWMLAVGGLIVLVFAASAFASEAPDGLESVAQDLGFAASAQEAPFELFADYAVGGVGGDLSTALAGIIGVAVVIGIVWLLARLLVRRPVDGAGGS